MKFKSIKSKLIIQVSSILIMVFVAVLSVVSYLSIDEAEKSLSRNQQQIKDALLAKGKLLTQNNSQAVKGMVEDNAFSSIQGLVASTVEADEDIVFGTFMDTDRVAWAQVTPENPLGLLTDRVVLEDENALWVEGLEAVEYKHTTIDGYSVYLFAAPVIVDDEMLGFIQYALTDNNMLNSIEAVRVESEKALIKTITVIVALALFTGIIGFIAVRKMAIKISRPLNALRDAAETISSGNYDQRVNVTSNDEIGLLANNFDTMRSTIQKKIEDLVELNTLGQAFTALKFEREIFELSLKNAYKHTNAIFGLISHPELGDINMLDVTKECSDAGFEVSPEEDGVDKAKAVFDEENQPDWMAVLKEKMSEQMRVLDVIQLNEFEAFGESHAFINIPFSAGEAGMGRFMLVGKRENIRYSDSDQEYFSSMLQMMNVSQNNIKLKCEIEEHNRNLEETVKQRTAALQEKTNDITNMMSNMHQGLFTIMGDGTVHHEYARYLENIFETRDIAGVNALDLLFDNSTLGEDSLNQVRTSVMSLIGSDEIMFDFNQHLLVNEAEVTFKGKPNKVLEFDWDPILLNDCIDKIMVTVRDVTALKALEGEAAEQKQELEIISQILAIETDKFARFITSSFDFIDKNRTIIEENEHSSEALLSELFRNMHTIKGNARTYGFSHITDDVHIAETCYDTLRKDLSLTWDKDQLLCELDAVREGLVRYRHVNQNVLKRGNGDSATLKEGQMVVDSDSVSALHDTLSAISGGELSEQVKKEIIKAKALLLMLDTVSLEDALDDMCQSTCSLAGELGKPAPDISINAKGVVVKQDMRELLNNVCMHSFRNSLDHGIEMPEERVNCGKLPEGKITVDASITDNQLEMRIYDDGQGLKLSKLREKAIQDGKIAEEECLSTETIANLLFAPGVSTAESVTQISGRGVGMDAVKKFIEEKGGNVKIALRSEREKIESEMALFELVITIPDAGYLKSA